MGFAKEKLEKRAPHLRLMGLSEANISSAGSNVCGGALTGLEVAHG
jgi:hypothetical protein